MKAVILAGGRGKRMGPLTLDTPKPMLRLCEKPLLEHTLDSLQGTAREAVIVVGYKKEAIMNYFGEMHRKTKISYVEQKGVFGTGHALQCVESALPGSLRERFVLLMADDFYPKEGIRECARFPDAILAQEVGGEEAKKFGVLTVKNGLARGIVEKPANPPSCLASTGCHVFNNLEAGGTGFSERGEIEYTDALKRIMQEREVHCIVTKKWLPMTSPLDIKRAEAILERRFLKSEQKRTLRRGNPLFHSSAP